MKTAMEWFAGFTGFCVAVYIGAALLAILGRKR
jgi:hypothetical protein